MCGRANDSGPKGKTYNTKLSESKCMPHHCAGYANREGIVRQILWLQGKVLSL